MKTLVLFLAILSMGACAPKQKTAATTPTEAAETAENEMDRKNKTIGIVMQRTTKEGCDWTIRVKGVSYKLDPINLDEAFMVNELKVRFDYLPLRMKNRCAEANPVEIKSMEKV